MSKHRDPIAAQFDEEGARKIEAIYLTPDVVAQRARVLEALALNPAERVVDLGCGPGLLAVEMAGQVGAAGAVEGTDFSASMISLAQRRCAPYAWTKLRVGDVTELAYADQSFDVAVCTQVYEYVPDVERALRELHRVLRPGGRAVVVDTDWESCVWHSSDPARMRRMLECWDTHCPHPQLPRTLAGTLRTVGLELTSCDVVALVNTAYDPNTYSHAMTQVMSRYAAKRLGEQEARAWAEDLHRKGQAGEYFFSLNRYLFACRKRG